MSNATPITPESLPEKPEGWTTKLIMHIAMSDKHGRYGIKSSRVHNAEGNPTTIIQGYNSHRVDGWSGFYIEHDAEEKVYKSWAELRAAWPTIAAEGPKR